MSIEPKYNITSRQFEYILELNETISTLYYILYACVSSILTSIFITVFTHNRWPQAMTIMFILGLLGTLIFGIRLYNVNKEKRELMQRIKNTAHYEIIQNNK